MTVHNHDPGPCDTCMNDGEEQTYIRYATIAVEVSTNWLTDNGQANAKDGWEEIKSNLAQAVERLPTFHYHNPPMWTWIEWTSEPELKDAIAKAEGKP